MGEGWVGLGVVCTSLREFCFRYSNSKTPSGRASAGGESQSGVLTLPQVGAGGSGASGWVGRVAFRPGPASEAQEPSPAAGREPKEQSRRKGTGVVEAGQREERLAWGYG